MDRTTARKMMNEFTADIDLTSPAGLMNAEKIDRLIMQALKPLLEEGKAFRKAAVNPSSGQRSISYAYQGSAEVQKSVTAALNRIQGAIGMEGAGKLPYNISQQQDVSYTEFSRRILDSKVKAAVMAQAVKSGGTAKKDLDSGYTSFLVPSDISGTIKRRITGGNSSYLSGNSSSASGVYSNVANVHERARAAIERQDRTATARMLATKEFVKNNPNSITAKRIASSMKKKARAASKSSSNLARGAFGGLIGTLVGLAAATVGVLSKILGGVLDTSRNTQKMMLQGARFNLSAPEMKKLGNMGINMGIDKDGGENSYAQIFGGIVGKYSDLSSPGFRGNISTAAKFLQKSTPDVISMINGASSNPEEFYYKIMSDAFNITNSGRAGVQTGQTFGKALMTNTPIVGDILGSDKAADQFNILMLRYQDEVSKGTIKSGAMTPELLQNLAESWYGTGNKGPGTSNTLQPSSIDQKAAQDSNKAVFEFSGILTGLKDLFFTKALDYLGEIVDMLRNWLRPYIAAASPSWGVRENDLAQKENARATAQVMGDIGLTSPDGFNLTKGQGMLQAYQAYKYALPGDKRQELEKFTKKYGNNAVDFMGQNAQYFTNIDVLNKLMADRNVTMKAPGAPDLPGQTRMSHWTRALVASHAVDMQMAVLREQATQNALLQSSSVPGLLPDGSIFGLPSNATPDQLFGAASNNKALAGTLSAFVAGFTGKSGDKSVLELLSKLTQGAPSKAPHQFIPELRDAGVTGDKITRVMDYITKNTRKLGGIRGTNPDLLISDLALTQKYVDLPDYTKAGLRMQASSEQGFKMRATIDLMRSEIETLAGKTAMAAVNSGAATAHVSGIHDGVVDVNIKFEDGKTKPLSFSISADGLENTGPGRLTKNGVVADLKVVAGRKSTTGAADNFVEKR